jgi:hypothetical protein
MEPLILARGGDKLGQPTYLFASIFKINLQKLEASGSNPLRPNPLGSPGK